jgi:hypothetical protein
MRRNRLLTPVALAVLAACMASASTLSMADSMGGARLADPSRAARADAPARAAAPAVMHHASDSRWHGRTLSELAERHWQWLETIPRLASQRDDSAGANCGINQQGPIWFLHNPNFTQPTQNCTVPAGKPIFGPLIALINDYPCPDPAFEPAAGQSLEASASPARRRSQPPTATTCWSTHCRAASTC